MDRPYTFREKLKIAAAAATALIMVGVHPSPSSIISATAYPFHRAPALRGSDAEAFRADRWFSANMHGKEKYLLRLGQGHRAWIDRKQSPVALWKVGVAIWRRSRVGAVDVDGKEMVLKGLEMDARGCVEIKGALRVMANKRE